MKLIPLSQQGKYKGKYSAMVDDEDFDSLSKIRWAVKIDLKTCYAENNRIGKLHRIIMSCPKNMEVDHIDGNGLNNQKNNLRVCSRMENGKNRRSYGMSKHLGVYKQGKKWRARLSIDRVMMINEFYNTEIEAAKAYNDAALKYHGSFAKLNEV